MIQLKFIILVYCFLSSFVFSLPVDNAAVKINSEASIDIIEPKNALSVDQILNSSNRVKQIEETTTREPLLFNNSETEEEKILKINEAEDLIESSNLSPQSKQQNSGMPNVQSLIDQTNTIKNNLDNMIKDLDANKRHATAAMLKLINQNVRRLNTSLVRLNSRVNSLSAGSSQSGTSSSSSSSPSSSSAISNATYNVASQINSVASNLRNQINALSNDVNKMLKNVRLQKPAGNTNNKPASTPSG